MTRPPDVIRKKTANAFFRDNQTLTAGHTFGGLEVDLLAALKGGVWLGGTVYLTPTVLVFELNRLNRLFHTGTSRVEIPLADVREVIFKPGIGFKIVQLVIPQGDFQIRVRHAREFADLIEATIAKARHG